MSHKIIILKRLQNQNHQINNFYDSKKNYNFNYRTHVKGLSTDPKVAPATIVRT